MKLFGQFHGRGNVRREGAEGLREALLRWGWIVDEVEQEGTGLPRTGALPGWRERTLVESVQSCGVVMLREPLGLGPRPAESLCANDGMHFPRCRSARECEHRGNSERCAGSISSVASSPFVWRQSR